MLRKMNLKKVSFTDCELIVRGSVEPDIISLITGEKNEVSLSPMVEYILDEEFYCGIKDWIDTFIQPIRVKQRVLVMVPYSIFVKEESAFPQNFSATNYMFGNTFLFEKYFCDKTQKKLDDYNEYDKFFNETVNYTLCTDGISKVFCDNIVIINESHLFTINDIRMFDHVYSFKIRIKE
jgi:hypothetical protein